MPATTAMMNYILKYYFGGTVTSSPAIPPTTMYFGLSTTEVTSAGLTSVTEPSVAYNYARVTMSNNTTTWNIPSAGQVSNKADIVFGVCQGTGWGKILSLFIVGDTASVGAGTVLWYSTLSPSVVIQVGSQLTFGGDVGGGEIVVTMT